LKLLGGAAGFAGVFWYVLHYGAEPVGGPRLSINTAIAAGVPGAYAIIGLIELCTGYSFTRLANAWDDLKGWQRGVLGILIVVTAFAITAGIFLGLAYWRFI
jgi:hypothetical protein